MLKRLFLRLLAALALLVVAVTVNTLRQGSRQLDVPPAPPLPVDEGGAALRLSEAIDRARTVSSPDDAQANADQFRQLHEFLQARYPKAQAVLEREPVGWSLLYTWKSGTDANTKVSGKPWGEFFGERVFRPLGMTATRVTGLTDLVPNRASGYAWTKGETSRMKTTGLPSAQAAHSCPPCWIWRSGRARCHEIRS